MTKEIKNVAASVKARLLNYARKEGIAFNRILVYYFQERFLYRVSISEYRNKLIFKGGALLLTLDINKGRPTKDIDFLAQYENLDHATAEKIIREIAASPADDGIVFDPTSVKCSNIREDGTINALRIRFNATLGSARGAMQIDIGYKDSVIPDPILFQYPTLLDLPVPLEGKRIQEAITGTFKKRSLSFDEAPVVFTEKFMSDETKQVQWKAFLKKTGLIAEESFATVASLLKGFLGPVVTTITEGKPFTKLWDPQKFQWV